MKFSNKGQDSVEYALVMFLVAIVLIVAVMAIRASLVPEEKAVRTFEANGYSNVQITHKAWFAVGLRGCGQDDAVRFDAIATNSAGQRVDDVYVCASWLKGGTLRTR